MLDILRKNTKLVVWIVVGAFILWGAFSVTSTFQKKGRYAGDVFGKPVSFQEFTAFQKAAQIFSFADESSRDPDVLRHKAWQNLIYSREGKRQKIQVSDDEVRMELRRLLASQGLENPTPAVYKRWLAATVRMEPREFEGQLREIIRIQKLVAQALKPEAEEPTPEETKDLFMMEEQKIAGQLVLFNTPEDAESFRAQATDTASWKKTVEVKGYAVLPSPEQSVLEFIRSWQVPKALTLKLLTLPAGSVSDVLPAQGKSGVFLLESLKPMTDADYTDAKKTEYLDKARKQKRRQLFFSWHLELMQRAKLHDYSLETEI